jgi:hypothetical protein
MTGSNNDRIKSFLAKSALKLRKPMKPNSALWPERQKPSGRGWNGELRSKY